MVHLDHAVDMLLIWDGNHFSWNPNTLQFQALDRQSNSWDISSMGYLMANFTYFSLHTQVEPENNSFFNPESESNHLLGEMVMRPLIYWSKVANERQSPYVGL